ADKRVTVAPRRRCDTMTRVRWRRAQIPILSALTLLLLALGVYHAAGVTRPAPDPGRAAAPSGDPVAEPPDPGPGRAAAPSGDPVPEPTAYAQVDPAPTGAPLPADFLGLSFEYGALEAYTGSDPAAPDPVFVQLLRNLGQPLVLRIGGNSTDATWWPVRGIKRPPGVSYAL